MAPKKVKPGATTRSNSQNRNIPHTPLNQTTDSETDDDELKLEGIDIETASTQDMLKFLCRQSVQIKQMQREIVSLKDQLRRRDDKVISLEHRVSDLEQYVRMDNLVVSGIDCSHRSYARVAGTANSADQNEHAPMKEQETLEQIVVKKLSENNIPITHTDISACYTLGKHHSGKSNIIIKLVNRKSKSVILRSARNLQGTNIYINEHLTKHNADLAREARQLRKSGAIESTWTRNCKVFIKFNLDGEHSKIAAISSLDELQKFK